MPGVSGNIIGLKVGGTFISCEVSCTMNFDKELLPATAVDSGGWKEYIYGVKGWSVSVNGNLLLESVGADIKTILTNHYIGDLPMFIQFSTRPSATVEMILSGGAMFQGGNITAQAAANASWACQLQGNGELQTTFQDYALLIDAMPPEARYPVIVEEDPYA